MLRECSADLAVNRAFLMAHLLTGDARQAESVVLEAIESWSPREDDGEALLQEVLNTAVRSQVVLESRRSFLPPELQAVLGLSPLLRRCFVLRMLEGLSGQVCARLLHVDSRLVDQCTRAAVKSLPAIVV
jgi:DNA-directed RNA polymerase specialized sigma24 family protein